jgi:hypothetical protein
MLLDLRCSCDCWFSLPPGARAGSFFFIDFSVRFCYPSFRSVAKVPFFSLCFEFTIPRRIWVCRTHSVFPASCGCLIDLDLISSLGLRSVHPCANAVDHVLLHLARTASLGPPVRFVSSLDSCCLVSSRVDLSLLAQARQARQSALVRFLSPVFGVEAIPATGRCLFSSLSDFIFGRRPWCWFTR